MARPGSTMRTDMRTSKCCNTRAVRLVRRRGRKFRRKICPAGWSSPPRRKGRPVAAGSPRRPPRSHWRSGAARLRGRSRSGGRGCLGFFLRLMGKDGNFVRRPTFPFFSQLLATFRAMFRTFQKKKPDPSISESYFYSALPSFR